MRRTRFGVTLTGVALAASLALPMGQALGAEVSSCGEVVTEDSRLVADLTGCGQSGIVIDADNVTLDLNGHAITGTGVWGSAGIGVDSHKGVTILNGTVSGFFEGIGFWGSDGNRIEGVTLSDNHIGITLYASSDNVLSHNTVTGSWAFPEPGSGGDGIAVVNGSHRNLIEGNTARANDSRGIIVVVDSNDNVLRQNHLVANAGGISVSDPSGDSIGNLIESNVVLRNTDSGIIVGLGNTVTGNVVIRNGDGIDGAPGVIDGGGNVAAANGQAGDPQCNNVVCLGPR